MPTHKECVNFRRGYCSLKNKAVDPNGPACDQFVPRRKRIFPLIDRILRRR